MMRTSKEVSAMARSRRVAQAQSARVNRPRPMKANGPRTGTFRQSVARVERNPEVASPNCTALPHSALLHAGYVSWRRLGGFDAIVVHFGEQLVGRLEQLFALRRLRARRVGHDLFQRARQFGVALALGIVAQVGEIGAERGKMVHGVGRINLRRRLAVRFAARPDQGGLELHLEIGVDDFLAGPHVLGAAEVRLDDADELVVEIAVEDRGEQRQHRDEHREIGEQRRTDRTLLVAHGPAPALSRSGASLSRPWRASKCVPAVSWPASGWSPGACDHAICVCPRRRSSHQWIRTAAAQGSRNAMTANSASSLTILPPMPGEDSISPMTSDPTLRMTIVASSPAVVRSRTRTLFAYRSMMT